MPINEISRRALLAGAAALALLPRAALAQATNRASALVEKLAADFIAALRSASSPARLAQDFAALLGRYGDMPVVAASVLGPPWRAATPAQKQAFVPAFQTYLARKYGSQFKDYQNATVAVTKAQDGGDKGVLVSTQVARPGRQPIAVDWQVSERSGQPKVVNLIIEGVSMLTNERTEVRAMLEAQGGSLDKLIAQMKSGA